MVKAILGLGCNVGDCPLTFNRAIQALQALPGISSVRTSSYKTTKPMGPVQDQPDFLNAVAEIETTLEPLVLLDHLKALEVQLGRVHRERWGPRELDLDILTYGGQVINHPRLQVPHPETINRPFLGVLMREILSPSPDGSRERDRVRAQK